MYILSNYSDTIVSTDNMLNMYLCEGNKTIRIQFVSGIFSKIGFYTTQQNAEIALNKLFLAMENGEKAFRMPQDADCEYPSGGKALIKTKATRHGGS